MSGGERTRKFGGGAVAETAARILIVEDEADMAEMLVSFFGEQQYSAAHCATGEDALVRARGETFDLVLLDIHLP